MSKRARMRCGTWFLTVMLAALLASGASAAQRAVRLHESDAPFGYYEYLPEGYAADRKWPLVIFLHGAGERGNGLDELERVLQHGPPRQIHNGAQYPFICISPQSPGAWNVEKLDVLIEKIKARHAVDEDRIYLTGISMGGYGAWRYAASHADKLAAMAPICPPGRTPDGAAYARLPIWVFHAWGDTMVSAGHSVRYCNAIAGAIRGEGPTDVMKSYPGAFTGLPDKGQRADKTRTANFDPRTGWTWQEGVAHAGGPLALTLYPDREHDCWTRTYANPMLWEWLLAQKRSARQ